jgi:hypothetical protein
MPQLLMTDRDAYWGAKIVTSFTDAQIAAAVHAGHYSPVSEKLLARILELRRDAVGRVWLTRSTALESPELGQNELCFSDLALARGYARSASYDWQILDVNGKPLTSVGDASRACVPVTVGLAPYQIVKVTATYDGKKAKPAYVHITDRIVGIDRAE